MLESDTKQKTLKELNKALKRVTKLRKIVSMSSTTSMLDGEIKELTRAMIEVAQSNEEIDE